MNNYEIRLDGGPIENIDVFFIPTNLVLDQTYHAPVTRSMTPNGRVEFF